MRVCHVCSGHTADDGRVFHRACKSLAQAGYDVHLVAAAPASAPYRAEGVTIHPLPPARTRRERLLRRSRVAQMAAQISPALFHVHEPELLGPVLVRAGDRPVIWDVHESYLDVLRAREWLPKGLRNALARSWDWQERRLVRRCAAVVAVTARIAERYQAMAGRVEVLANYPDLDEMITLPPADQERDGKTCVFAGGLTWDRGLFEVVRALAVLKAHGLEVPLQPGGGTSTSLEP